MTLKGKDTVAGFSNTFGPVRIPVERSWLELLSQPVRVVETPPPSHPRERLHLEVRPFIYFDANEGYICEGGEIVLEDLDLETDRATGRVHLKAKARATLRLLGEKEPKP